MFSFDSVFKKTTPVQMEEAQAYEGVYPKPGFLERAKQSGPIGMAGLATTLLSVILVLAAPHLTLSRRRLLALLGLAFCLGVSGYVVFDYQYITLNLSLHDAQTFRADCMALLQQKESAAEGSVREVPPSNVNFPSSFSRLGAKTALVMNGTVRICLYTDSNGGQWGVLYDPQRGWSKSGMPRGEVRPTWHRDLYEFRVRGE